ncbi:hypothetical protein HYFRA_00001349 [Hymenoscyphus fraxineus]|uniref:Uncharacterized protein n=1 Tax=Hymenoscyphus fraxineus TaxID=746836 RepID=A0A9N9PTS0_9HELO|nr:hypothetical protein HYFRA_00001349 [Hymenoscyphus fraxineus]
MQLQNLVIIALFTTSAHAAWRNAWCNKPFVNDGDDRVATAKACDLAKGADCHDCVIGASGYCYSQHNNINIDTWNGYCTSSGGASGDGYE